MTACIYCQKTLLEEEEQGDDRQKRSREHVIPNALGGPDGLCTFDVCKGCNSRLGETIDGDFAKQPLVVMLRHRHRLQGYSGNIPDLTMPATSMQSQDAYTMRVTSEGEVSFTRPPDVRKNTTAAGQLHVEVGGDEGQIRAIIEGMRRKYAAKGYIARNLYGSEMRDLDQSIEDAPSIETREFKVQTPLDISLVRRALIKVAFNFGHVVLGPQWTFGPGAKRLREAVLGELGEAEIDACVMGLGSGIREALPFEPPLQENEHLVMLMAQTDQSYILVSLLGDPLLTMAVKLDAPVAMIEEAMIASNRIAVRAKPAGGGAQWIGPLEFAQWVLRRDR